MGNVVRAIPIEKLLAHPGNPNRMSKGNFGKLVRNIKRTGMYEPIVVRPEPQRRDCYQIINGHHRWMALTKLGYKEADCVVWDVDDAEADILISTLNRLCGTDDLGRKLSLLRRMSERMGAEKLARILPQTKKQIQRLMNFRVPMRPGEAGGGEPLVVSRNPMMFFLTDGQQDVVKSALSAAEECSSGKQKAVRSAEALVYIAKRFLDNLGN